MDSESSAEKGALTMSWLSLDPTTLCVLLLVLALSGLWVYVTVVKGSTKQPNFNVLHEPVTKKAPTKNKGKRKQVSCLLVRINWNKLIYYSANEGGGESQALSVTQ